MSGKFSAVPQLHSGGRRDFRFLLSLLLLVLSGSSQAQLSLSGWGQNALGQLGDETRILRATPVSLPNPPGLAAVAGGGAHSLALMPNRTVWAWGRNSTGQLGNDLPEIEAPYGTAEPVSVVGLTGIVAVAGGQSHSLALAGDGTVWAWGQNELGQVANGFNTDNPIPFLIPEFSFVTAISAGMFHSLALKSDGTVWQWGFNGNGDVSLYAFTVFSRPYVIRGQNGTGVLSDIVAIAAGGFHNLALKSDGTVWAWGRNACGQLGDMATIWRPTPAPVRGPNGVGYLSQIVAVAGGADHSLALGADGTVWAWGRNTMGQLGDGTETDHFLPARVSHPSGQGFLSDIVAIAAGGFHNLALKSDGTVWAWGSTRYGQTGNALSGDDLLGVPHSQALPGQVPGLQNGVAVACGDFHAFALTAPNATVSGTITLEDSLNPAQLLTVRLRPTNGAPPIVRQMYLGADGSFRLTNLPQQSYQAHIKGAKWLAKVITIDVSAGNVSGLATTLLAGDANNDNSVDVLDLDRLLSAFDTAEGDAGFQPGADFDGDGVVSVLDLDLVLRNFDRAGDP